LVLPVRRIFAGLLLLLPAVVSPAQAPSRWPEERVAGPFLCHAEFPLDENRRLLSELQELQDQIVAALAVERPREPIHMFLFQRRATYEQYVRQYFPDVPHRRALFIKLRGPGMVFAYESRELAVDVRHESTHALLHTALPMVPLWLDEGLAEYFEVAAEQRASGHEHLRSIQWRSRLGWVPAIEDLESLDDVNDMSTAHYQRAWAWVHFMLHGPPEAREELQRFLADIAAYTPPGRLSQRLQRRVPDLELAFREHFRSWK
jgi:hypothetical protein